MGRATWVLATTTAIGFATSAYLYFDNRALRDDRRGDAVAQTPTVEAKPRDAWLDAPRLAAVAIPTTTRTEPALPPEPTESKLDKRARRTLEISAFLGRHDGETDDEYRARMVPLVSGMLADRREKVAEMRKAAEEKAHVTAAQSAKLDKAFEKVYSDVLDYTNKAITDGQLSPYERNVSGWLEFAGGMGGMLGDAQGQIGKILDPAQMRAMYDSGFEWGEYLGLQAPWEKLTPPPPAPK